MILLIIVWIIFYNFIVMLVWVRLFFNELFGFILIVIVFGIRWFGFKNIIG